jgi:pimeloyl-ACP methyl ester carboxylesterase
VTEGFIDIRGARTYFEVAGSGPAVVFIHGFSLDTRMWDAQFAAFAERYRAVRYDVRGFGRSQVPDGEPYSAERDLKALLGHLGIERPALIGHSMGGGIAIDYAITYPDEVRAVVLVDGVMGGYHWDEELDESLGAVYEVGRAEGVEEARARWLAQPIFGPGLANERTRHDILRIINEFSGWHWTNSEEDRNVRPDPPAMERLHQITVPVLAVVGELDIPDFHRIAAILEGNLANARSAVLAGAGHMSNMEAPEEFNRIALEFLDSL